MDQAAIKLSVCLCTYNRIDYLKLTLKHLLKELHNTSITYEVIITDGGSTDGSVEYIKSLDHTTIIEQGLSGSAKAYFSSFKIARGNYILGIHDHMLVNLGPLIKAMCIMDSNPEVAAIMIKQYIIKKRSPFKVAHVSFSSLITGDLFFFRRNDLHYFDTSYHHYWWGTDFILKMLSLGKVIAYTRQISTFEIKIKHKDSLHSKSRSVKGIKESTDYFYNKWAGLIKLLEDDFSTKRITRTKTKVCRGLLKLFIIPIESPWLLWVSRKWLRLIELLESGPEGVNNGPKIPGFFIRSYSRIKEIGAFRTLFARITRIVEPPWFSILSAILSWFGYRPRILPEMPDIPENELPSEFREAYSDLKLDRRHRLPWVEKVLSRLWEGTSGYVVRKPAYEDLLLVQKLPDSVISVIKS